MDLDGAITAYETKLADHLAEIRQAPLGGFASPTVAAEVVAHLYFRTSALRSLLSRMALEAQAMKRNLATPRMMLRYVGADQRSPGRRFDEFVDYLLDDPKRRAATAGVPRRRLRKMLFNEVRKEPGRFVADMALEIDQEGIFSSAEDRALIGTSSEAAIKEGVERAFKEGMGRPFRKPIMGKG